MAFFDDLKKNLSDVTVTLQKTSESALKKSNEVLELQKAKVRKTSIERKLDEAYAKLGKSFYEKYAEGELPEELTALCQEIADAKAAVMEAEQMVASLRGTVICPQCHSEVSKDSAFCPKCGAEIVIIEEEDSEEEIVEEAAEEIAEAVEEAVEAVEEAVEEAAEAVEEAAEDAEKTEE